MTDDHIVVVGGTRGLGRATANRFLERGGRVTVISRNAPETVLPGNCVHVASDLETLTDAAATVEAVIAVGGPVRYVVFCQRYRGSGDAWAGELQVGLTATRLLVEAFADKFCDGGDRAFAMVSSVYAQFVGGSQPAGYHAVKAGLNQLVRYYAWVMGRRGIRANAIMPLTYMKAETRAFYGAQEKLLNTYDRFVPLRRMGDAEDSVNLLDFLCSDRAAFINGQCIFVDGGVSAMWPEEIAKSFSAV